MQERWAAIREQVAINPALLRDVLREFHTTEQRADNDQMDILLGITVFRGRVESGRNADVERLREKYGDEAFGYVGTGYGLIRQAIHGLDPQQSDVVYDLGSGYGRFPLYGALTTDAQYKGVEILPERVVAAQAAKKKFNIENVDFVAANVLDVDFSDGTMFYLYQPFTDRTETIVWNRLDALAKQKHIRIATFDSINAADWYSWLRLIYSWMDIIKVYKNI